MKKVLDNIRNTVIAGIVLLIPVFVIIMILEKFYARMTGFGTQLANFLGVKSLAGIGAASIATTLILLSLFYVCGLLVRFSFLKIATDWIEKNVLQFIPGYLGYKVKMEEKLLPRQEPKIPVLIRTGDITRPGYLKSKEQGKCVVFVPNTPDPNSGEIWVVDEQCVTDLHMDAKAFSAAVMHGGKGLAIS